MPNTTSSAALNRRRHASHPEPGVPTHLHTHHHLTHKRSPSHRRPLPHSATHTSTPPLPAQLPHMWPTAQTPGKPPTPTCTQAPEPTRPAAARGAPKSAAARDTLSRSVPVSISTRSIRRTNRHANRRRPQARQAERPTTQHKPPPQPPTSSVDLPPPPHTW